MHASIANEVATAMQQTFGTAVRFPATKFMDPAERAAMDPDIDIHAVVLLAEQRGIAQWEDEYGDD